MILDLEARAAMVETATTTAGPALTVESMNAALEEFQKMAGGEPIGIQPTSFVVPRAIFKTMARRARRRRRRDDGNVTAGIWRALVTA